METLIEFLPLVAFFATYRLSNIYIAVAVLMCAMAALLAWRKLTGRPISGMLWGSTALAFLFGGATLALHDVRFIQWKPTIFYWLVGTAFLISHFVGKEPLAQRFLAPALGTDGHLPARDWRVVNVSWVAFWGLLGAANLYVVKHFSESDWVSFKVIGTTAAMVVFMVAQGLWISRRARLAAPSPAASGAPPDAGSPPTPGSPP